MRLEIVGSGKGCDCFEETLCESVYRYEVILGVTS